MPRPFRPSTPGDRLFPLALGLLLLSTLACGGGSGTDASTGATGSVAVLVTDAPSEELLQLLLEVTKVELLGDAGRATLFEDPDGREFDLLSLRDEIRVIGLGRRVPVGDWQKLRLRIRNARLVRIAPGGDRESCPEDVAPDVLCESLDLWLPGATKPGGGTLDLNPRGTISVRAGELLLVRLDMDAAKSVKLTQTGSGKHILRPIVFVDAFARRPPDRLVLLEGAIEDVDGDGGTFELCDDHGVFDAASGERRHREETSDDDRCIEVRVGPATTIFDPDGGPLALDELEEGSFAAVLGRFRLDAGEKLRFDAEVVQVGGREAVDRVAGRVVLPIAPTGGDFDIAPDPDGPVQVPLLPIQLLEGAKLFSREGKPLTPADIEPGQRVRAFGWLVLANGEPERFDAGVVFVDAQLDEAEETVLRGEVTAPFDPESGTFEIWPEASSVVPRCVALEPGADVFRVAPLEDTLRSQRIEAGGLMEGEQVDVFGEEGVPCFRADTVISLGFGT